METPRVLIVGGGFGGLNAAKALARLPIKVTLVDRNNFHLFQPLLYQVATAGLSAVDVAAPIRHVLRRHSNVEVLMAEVSGMDLGKNQLLLKEESPLTYDYLVLAPGSHYNYFGHEAWAKDAPSLKTIRDALEIRRRVLSAYEEAEMQEDPDKRRECLNFVVVGGGPTGVELAGALAELAHNVLVKDFRRIDPTNARVLLVEAGSRVLAPFPEVLSKKAHDQLEEMGVEIKVHTKVEDITSEGVTFNGEFFPARNVLWAAGVQASPLLKNLGYELDRMGRIVVQPDLSLSRHPNVFVIGDAANFSESEGKSLPGLAPVAIQQGQHLRRVLHSRIKGEKQGPPFRYFDKGQLATVGWHFAVAHMGTLKTAGFTGWLIWAFVHILYLVGFKNRAAVFLSWAWQYMTYDRGARLIVKEN